MSAASVPTRISQWQGHPGKLITGRPLADLEFFAQKAALFSFNKLETGGFYFGVDPDAAEAGAGSDSQNVPGAFGQ